MTIYSRLPILLLVVAVPLIVGEAAGAAPAKKLAPAAALSDRGKKIKCWYLRQKNMIFGDCEIYASPQALKVTFANEKWANLAKPPDWDLLVFNPKAKIYCRTPLKEWRGRKLGSTFVKNLQPLNKTEIVCGLPTRVYDAQSLDTGARALSRIYCAEALGLPDQIYTILCGNAALPKMKGAPLKVEHAGGDAPGKSVNTYEARQISMPASFFAVPAGFRQVVRPEEVMTGGISDIIEDMAR